jgi:hypothetical protein
MAAAFLVAVPAYALATGGLPALAKIERGRWQVRNMDSNSDVRTICVGDPMLLAQIDHDGAPCAAEVIESGLSGGTVRYVCEGRGLGHSVIKIQTPRSVTVTTQGLNQGRPFSYRAAANKIGDC